MLPAEHRALRELGAFTGQLTRHWESLAGRLGGGEATVLRAGADDGRALLAALEPLIADRGLAARPAAQVAGTFVTPRPSPSDLLLERNQALRFAVLDVQHCVTLLGYLGRLAAADGDTELEAFLGEMGAAAASPRGRRARRRRGPRRPPRRGDRARRALGRGARRPAPVVVGAAPSASGSTAS